MRISPSISPRNLRIAGASLIAVLMVAGGYFLPGSKFPKTKEVNAELTDELLASYVAKDTDGDGLVDWQESLYGTDINKSDSDGDGISDGDAVRQGLLTPTSLSSELPAEEGPIDVNEIPVGDPAPGSVTDEFSKAFFEAYMRESGGQPMDADAQNELVQRLLADYTARGVRALGSSYTLVSVRQSPGTTVHDYAVAVQSVLQNEGRAEGATEPMQLMQALMENKDESARQKLLKLANAQTSIARALLTMSVPPQLADEHLLMLQSTDSLGKSTRMIANYEKDPIGAMSALAIYAPTSRSFLASLQGVGTTILSQGGEPAPGTAEAYMVANARILENL
jgi:hypothetical protein